MCFRWRPPAGRRHLRAVERALPAPPVIALVGLFGILLGEQVVPLAKQLIERQMVSVSVIQEDCGAHVFGRLPGRCGGSAADLAKVPSAHDS
jgi:xanthosine utilization system XapX-like protein